MNDFPDLSEDAAQDELLQAVRTSPDPYTAACLTMGTMAAILVMEKGAIHAALLISEMAETVLKETRN